MMIGIASCLDFAPNNDRRYYNKGSRGHDGSNAGRPALSVPRKTYSIRCTEEEIGLIRQYLKKIREK